MTSSRQRTLLLAALALVLGGRHAAGQDTGSAKERGVRAAELRETRQAQETYESQTKRLYLELNAAQETSGQITADAIFGSPIAGVSDPRYVALSSELAQLRRRGLDALFAAPPRAPAPPPLSNATRALIGDEDAARFAAIAGELEGRVPLLEARRREALTAVADYNHLQSKALTSAFANALRRSPLLRDDLRSIREETGTELGGEAVQTALRVGYWARLRLSQLNHLPQTVSYAGITQLIWDISKFGVLLIVLFWALRRWDTWMRTAIEVIGRSLTYGRSVIVLVRLAESAKKFGPPLLILASALATYRIFPSLAAEIELALELTIAISAIRVQLRLVESVIEGLERRRLEREQEQAALEADSTGDSIAAGDAPAPVDDAPPPLADAKALEPFWALFAKTWRRLTRYVAVFAILMVVTNFAVGRGVFYGVLLRWAWLGAIPLTLFFLRTWRARIVHELTVRSKGDGEQTFLSRIASRHSHRIIGIPIVLLAFIVVLGRRTAAFVRKHFFELNSTKKALAFLFRRSVQKHARAHGRVLEKPHELPTAISEQFGPIRPAELAPLTKTVLPELFDVARRWQEEGVNASVALVGASGMAKTCLMQRFEEELPPEIKAGVSLVHLEEKVTKPARLHRWLAEKLGLAELAPETSKNERTEAQIIAALRDGEPRIIMIDSCHHLFLRRVGGFEAWDSFVRIVNGTGRHVFWVISMGKAAWDYLGNVTDHVAYFRHVIIMPGWSETDLRRLILGRMRRSGYQVNFSDLLVTRIEGVQMTSQIIRTSHGYFRLLWDYARGNPTLASYFWLRSLVPVEGAKSVRVNLFAAPRIEELEALSDNIAFVLTAIVEHESASAEELAAITNLAPELCRFAVRYGRERGYLERRGERVVISKLWHETILTYLKRKHLLYT